MVYIMLQFMVYIMLQFMVYVMLLPMLNVFYFYISTFPPSACTGSNMAAFCRSLISYFLSMLLRLLLLLLSSSSSLSSKVCLSLLDITSIQIFPYTFRNPTPGLLLLAKALLSRCVSANCVCKDVDIFRTPITS